VADTTIVTLDTSKSTFPFGANSVQRLAADTVGIQGAIAFIPDTTGTVSIRGQADSANVIVPVVAGAIYPIDISQFSKTLSTPNTTTIVLLKRAP
jgi:hypothetical protein